VDTARRYDLTILRKRVEDFAGMMKGRVVVADKGYVSKDFA